MSDVIMEKVNFPLPGKYVVAVSGGVDSMCLLDLLVTHGGYELIVAHLDHGMRPDSSQDMEVVHAAALAYGLTFIGEVQELGDGASEDTARSSRYQFLSSVAQEHGADAIITAHHLDDRIETMLLNRQRGAGWLGLAPLSETEHIKRPLLAVWKEELRAYAERHNLTWREDATNYLDHTPRNHIRHQLEDDRNRKHELHQELQRKDAFRQKREAALSPIMKEVISAEGTAQYIERSKLLALDIATARDVLFLMLKYYPEVEITHARVVRLEHFVKTARIGKKFPLCGTVYAESHRNRVSVYRLGPA